MKRITYYFALVVVTGLASCSNSNDEYTSEQKQEIKVDTSIQGMLTRTDQNTSEINDNAFVNGSAFRLYLTNSSGGAISDTPEAGYFTVTKNAGGYSFDKSAYYPLDGSSVDAFAIYPSTVAKGASSFSVVPMQSVGGAYNASDLMYAYKANNTSSSNPISLQFKHCLSKIVVKVVNADGSPCYELDGYDVEIDNMYIKGDLTFTNNAISVEVDGTSQADIIQLGSYDSSYGVTGIVIPQTFTPGDNIYFKDVDEGKTYSYCPDAPFDMKAGNVYTFKLTLDRNSLSGSYSISPWTNNDKTGDLSLE